MKKLSLLPVAFALLVGWFCSKDKEEPMSFPKHFVWTGIRPKGKLRLFYDKKEITDQTLIDTFLTDKITDERYNRRRYLLFEDQMVFSDTLLTFLAKDTLKASFGAYVVSHKDHKFTFVNHHSIAFDYRTFDVRKTDFVKHRIKNDSYIPSNWYTVTDVFNAYGDYNTINLPVLC